MCPCEGSSIFHALSLVSGGLMRLISGRRIRTGRESRDIKRLPGLSIHHADLRCARTAPVTLGGCWRWRGKHWEEGGGALISIQSAYVGVSHWGGGDCNSLLYETDISSRILQNQSHPCPRGVQSRADGRLWCLYLCRSL